jgi:hypothetical protein
MPVGNPVDRQKDSQATDDGLPLTQSPAPRVSSQERLVPLHSFNNPVVSCQPDGLHCLLAEAIYALRA